jgi:excisionase family DNA binding protein
MSDINFDRPIALGIVQAARTSGTSRSRIYEALKSGELRAKKLGRRTVILRSDLEAWIGSLPSYGSIYRGPAGK